MVNLLSMILFDILLITIFLTTLAGVLHMKMMLEPITKQVPLNTT